MTKIYTWDRAFFSETVNLLYYSYYILIISLYYHFLLSCDTALFSNYRGHWIIRAVAQVTMTLFPKCIFLHFVLSFMTVRFNWWYRLSRISVWLYSCLTEVPFLNCCLEISPEMLGLFTQRVVLFILLTNRYSSAFFFTLNSFPYNWPKLLFYGNMNAIDIVSAYNKSLPSIHSKKS